MAVPRVRNGRTISSPSAAFPLQQATILESEDEDSEDGDEDETKRALVEYEPDPEEILQRLIPAYVEISIFRALLESNAAFYAAQMTAMDAATRNSADMIEGLTLTMNKVRQAAITREIIEVVSGASA